MLDFTGLSGHKTGMRREDLPTSPEKLLETLQSLDISYEIYAHRPVFTVAESEDVEQDIPGLHCRNLFLRDKKGGMFLVTAANETEINLKALAGVLGCGRLSFGSQERLWEHLGIYPGAVCPFAVINDTGHQVQVVLDALMMGAETVCYHPLDNAQTVGLSPADLLKFFAHTGHAPLSVDFSAPSPHLRPRKDMD